MKKMLSYNERIELELHSIENHKSKILIVDDNPKNLQYAAKVLIEAGYDVSVAQNGTNALSYVQRSSPPDLILLDVMMPGMSGFEVCEKLKSSSSTSGIPIIFLTAKTETEDIVKGFELGGVDYISKPFQPKEILVRIKTHIDLVTVKRQLEVKNRLLDNFNKNLIEQVQLRTNELISTKNDVESYRKIKSEFLAQMSHEIRTPINVIINYLNLIQMDKSEEEGENELYTAINSASKRLIRTVEMILTMAELQQQTFKIEKSNILLYNDILDPLMEQYRLAAENKSLNFIIENNAFIQNVLVDKDSMFQVFDNILDNAIKFTKNGKITISIFNDSESTITVTIEDSGIGISDEYKENLFTPFTQEHEGYSRKFEGNGLGLSVSKGLCQLNNTELLIESTKNIGTKVIIRLPIEL